MRFDLCNCSDAKHHGPTRRGVLAMMGAAVASPALGLRRAQAQSGGEWIIDTHHHIYPPGYVTANLTRIVEDSRALPSTAYTG